MKLSDYSIEQLRDELIKRNAGEVTTPEKIKITSASRWYYWYADFVGTVYRVKRDGGDCYYVFTDSGSLWVDKQDCEAIKN